MGGLVTKMIAEIKTNPKIAQALVDKVIAPPRHRNTSVAFLGNQLSVGVGAPRAPAPECPP
jgi:hypothetical protein